MTSRNPTRTTRPVSLLLLAVCLLVTTGAKQWVNDAARERRGDYPAWIVPVADRPDSAGVVTFYALGDQGKDGGQQTAVARLLRHNLTTIGPREVRPFVLGAGDNYYPDGLPAGWPRDHVTGLFLDRRFGQVYADCHYDGRPLTFHLVHGNHDYYGDVLVWETFAEKRFQGMANDMPRLVSYTLRHDSIPDTNNQAEYDALAAAADSGAVVTLPELVPVPTGRIAIVALDTPAMIRLQEEARRHDSDDGPNIARAQLEAHWTHLRDLLVAHAQVQWTIVVGHHPVATHGSHGGYNSRPLGLHLHAFWKKINALVGRRSIQDLGYPAYDAFAERLMTELAVRRRVLYVSGHDHNLQMIWYKDRLMQVVSGAGSKRAPVTKDRDTVFKTGEPGLVRFDLAGEELWVEFIYGSADVQRGSTAFRINL